METIPSTYSKAALAYYVLDCFKTAGKFLLTDNRSHRAFSALMTVLFGIFIVFFILYAYAEKTHDAASIFYGNPKFSFVDQGYPERFGYFLELFCSAMFTAYAISHKKFRWLAWAGIFFIVFMDDSFGAHESIGLWLSEGTGMSRVTGELAGFAMMGGAFLILWFTGLFTGDNAGDDLKSYFVFSFYFGLLICFGVGVDAIHSLVLEQYHVPETLMALAEDGMEMFMCLITAISALGMWCVNKDKLPWMK